ncbi:unnamed protein product [Linum tenue]|uniref:Longin domain-containing protein n=1 Tax=Linum tenue TaxID=586396 RepID=A0AAV0N1N8_9ROSI|nr:unnamed protein product [Linum tenue]
MISNPDLILYACIAKGSTILAEFASPSEPGIEEIAQKCIGIAPPHHTTFSHTAKKKTYTFLIDDPFVYFTVFHHDLAKLESSWFIDRVKVSFLELIASNSLRDLDNLASLCFQAEFYPLFREILALDLDLGDSLTETTSKDSRNPSMDSTKEKTVTRPLLMKKKKRSSGVCSIGGMEDKSSSGGGGHHRGKDGSGLSCGGMSDHGGKMMMNGGGGVLVGENGSVDGSGHHTREFSVAMTPKSGGLYMLESRQKAKQMWRKHVWVVLTLDLVICAVLFFVWLWVCRGFTCIDG